jgi:NADH-quinone oxidoreductase subunit A
MTALVGYLLLFVVVGIGFIFVHLLAGKLIRPAKPEPEKLTIYECGEPTIGSAWIQFDLRFYVVALLFVIFDVEVAFFFPWAVVFGQANTLAAPAPAAATRAVQVEAFNALTPAYREDLSERQRVAGLLARDPGDLSPEEREAVNQVHEGGHRFAWLAFWDILVFFGVLLVGFAYLWRRGDLVWVRSTAAERLAPAPAPGPVTTAPAAPAPSEVLVGAGPGH